MPEILPHLESVQRVCGNRARMLFPPAAERSGMESRREPENSGGLSFSSFTFTVMGSGSSVSFFVLLSYTLAKNCERAKGEFKNGPAARRVHRRSAARSIPSASRLNSGRPIRTRAPTFAIFRLIRQLIRLSSWRLPPRSDAGLRASLKGSDSLTATGASRTG